MTDAKAERETIVRWSDDPDESMTVFTFRETAARKLLKAGATLKREGKRDGKVVSWTLEMPREWFKWPRKPSAARAEAARRRHQDGSLGPNGPHTAPPAGDER